MLTTVNKVTDITDTYETASWNGWKDRGKKQANFHNKPRETTILTRKCNCHIMFI